MQQRYGQNSLVHQRWSLQGIVIQGHLAHLIELHLKKKKKNLLTFFWDSNHIISSFLFPPPDPPICASLLSIKLMASFDLNCCYICVCVTVCIQIYLNNTSKTFSKQVKRTLFEERPKTQKTEIEKIRRGNWARLDDCGGRGHRYPHILP